MRNIIFLLFISLLFVLYLPYLKAGWGTGPCPLPVGKNQQNGFYFGSPANSRVMPLPNRNVANQQNFNVKKNNNDNTLQKNISDWNYALTQYQIFYNSKVEDVERGLSSFDFRIKYAAVLVVGEKNLIVGNKLFDLLDDRNEYVQQAARKALAVKSYYLIKEMKEFNNVKNKNLKVNPSALKVGIDYVDFGPLPYDSEDLISVSISRWKDWFLKKEKDLALLQSKKSNFENR